MDLMHIEDDYVLDLVEEATCFSAAKFVEKHVNTEKVLETIIQCWSSVYTNMPHTIVVDEGAQHRDMFGELLKIYDIYIQKSGTGPQNSLSIGEKYHKSLCKTFLKLQEDHPSLKKDLVLTIATKKINDNLGPECIVP